MAKRSTKTVPAPVEAAPAPETTYLPSPVATLLSTPKTRAEIALRDAVRSRLLAVEASVGEFIQEKQAEGFSMQEIDQLYAVELPISLAYQTDGGRIRVRCDAQIVERAS
ncbi:hypothetical protein [Gellertiella hungarica]|uniref:Uncharacterized protein n=1 Tax=Gellertiella hungarica TaxID=1572859 RepID=A0A7W6NJR5_9HYPH|nr:hypothetical protein [Gellertiella hungarica]MBB4064028.1 hypothetical protein [Gellertiella hungarica]